MFRGVDFRNLSRGFIFARSLLVRDSLPLGFGLFTRNPGGFLAISSLFVNVPENGSEEKHKSYTKPEVGIEKVSGWNIRKHAHWVVFVAVCALVGWLLGKLCAEWMNRRWPDWWKQ
ncbi:MAG: hypothetical protein WC378_15815 [Opitutaceae bacterium]